jgi:hypothetical protein
MTERQADQIIEQLTSIVRLLSAYLALEPDYEGPATIAEGMEALTKYEIGVD